MIQVTVSALKSARKNKVMKRGTKLTILGIALGLLVAAGIGVLLYILNTQNRFD